MDCVWGGGGGGVVRPQQKCSLKNLSLFIKWFPHRGVIIYNLWVPLQNRKKLKYCMFTCLKLNKTFLTVWNMQKKSLIIDQRINVVPKYEEANNQLINKLFFTYCNIRCILVISVICIATIYIHIIQILHLYKYFINCVKSLYSS